MNDLTKTQDKWKWGTDMKHRYFWGMPHTETEILAFKTTITARAPAVEAGQFAAALAVESALERVTNRSATLLQIDTLFTVLGLLLTTRAGADQAVMFLQLNRWAVALALVGSLILVTNLRLVWASDAARHYGSPDAAYDFHMDVYKSRAWRYSTALVLSIAAYGCTLLSITQMAPMK
jgi:hypothetical protein